MCCRSHPILPDGGGAFTEQIRRSWLCQSVALTINQSMLVAAALHCIALLASPFQRASFTGSRWPVHHINDEIEREGNSLLRLSFPP
jgi:hypothetical protein